MDQDYPIEGQALSRFRKLKIHQDTDKLDQDDEQAMRIHDELLVAESDLVASSYMYARNYQGIVEYGFVVKEKTPPTPSHQHRE